MREGQPCCSYEGVVLHALTRTRGVIGRIWPAWSPRPQSLRPLTRDTRAVLGRGVAEPGAEAATRGLRPPEAGAEDSTARSRSTSSRLPKQVARARAGRHRGRGRCRSTLRSEAAGRRRQPEPVLRRLPHPTRSRAASPTSCAPSPRRTPTSMKLEQIGTSTLGKPILAIKITENARNVAGRHASRDALLRGQPRARVDRRRDGPSSAALVRRPQGRHADPRADQDPRAVVPADPEPGRLRLHVHLRHRRRRRRPCDYRTASPNNRFWRKTLRDNDDNGVYGDSQDGVDPNRNYPAKRGIDEEGASQHASAARPTAVRTRCPSPRTSPSTASSVASSSGEHQLPLRGPAAADAGLLHTDYYPPDSTLSMPSPAPTATRPCSRTARSTRRTSTSPTATRSTTRT